VDFNSGGKKVIERLVEAYGFSTRQALCDHLGVSKSTMATRYMRDIFPADWVLQCVLETGTPIEWLAFGKGQKLPSTKPETIALPKKIILDGKVEDKGSVLFDSSLLPDNLLKPGIVTNDGTNYLIEQQFNDITDGSWLVEIEGRISIRFLTRIPIGKVRVSNSDGFFECQIDDIIIHAKCIFVLMAKI
jgi:phage repressor protein C with HTH and peptisase S24 domain